MLFPSRADVVLVALIVTAQPAFSSVFSKIAPRCVGYRKPASCYFFAMEASRQLKAAGVLAEVLCYHWRSEAGEGVHAVVVFQCERGGIWIGDYRHVVKEVGRASPLAQVRRFDKNAIGLVPAPEIFRVVAHDGAALSISDPGAPRSPLPVRRPR